MDSTFEVTFLGTNGSCAYNGGNRPKYGTNTACVAVRAGGETLIFDLGSGIVGLHGLPGYQRARSHVFFSHYHIDHISGLLFFPDLFDPQKRLDFYGGSGGNSDFREILNRFVAPPLHPVGLDIFKAALTFHPTGGGETIPLPGGVAVRTCKLSHPGGALGYRVEYGGKAVCYCADVELANHQNDPGLAELTRGADLLILDSFFDDGKTMPAWGHSSPSECAGWAARANAKKLALFHYGYAACDADIGALEEKARKIFPGTFASADFMRVEI